MKHRLLTNGFIFLRLHKPQRLHHEKQSGTDQAASGNSCGHTPGKRFLKPSQGGPRSDQMVLARMVWLLLSQTYHRHAPAGTTTRNKLRQVTATFLDDENSLERRSSYGKKCFLTQNEDCYNGQLTTGNEVRA
ncbi:hypothetical protein GCK32_008643 [Trichostrongylus colubriformis]|uniref:Uncharacterized protein n=1 Tax=Trichostrongylus colubriformis TaxID=6319 RepID=A0AAN8FWM6_TRICO